MFQFPRLAFPCGMAPLTVPGCPIREPPGHRLLTPHRRFSWLATPFIGYLRLGIHRTLLVASPSPEPKVRGELGITALFACAVHIRLSRYGRRARRRRFDDLGWAPLGAHSHWR